MTVDAIRLLQEAEQFAENKNKEAEAEKKQLAQAREERLKAFKKELAEKEAQQKQSTKKSQLSWYSLRNHSWLRPKQKWKHCERSLMN